MVERFADRKVAGRLLAARLGGLGLRDPLVLGLPRGGVVVAHEVAAALDVPLEAFVSRKIGAPGRPEFGIGAVAEGLDQPVWSDVIGRLGLVRGELEALAAPVWERLSEQVRCFRGDRVLQVADRDVVVVDDGLATGITAEAALRALGTRRPHRLTLAVPVCAAETAERLEPLADEVICVISARRLRGVSAWYARFPQTTDEEVLRLLATRRTRGSDPATVGPGRAGGERPRPGSAPGSHPSPSA